MSEICSVAECGRPVNAAKLCPTHRRRKRLRIKMDAPIRRREVSLSDLMTDLREIDELESVSGMDQVFERRVRRFRRLVKRWAACP